MNLNHIAKKPFFDLFYRTPCMPLLLRAAFHDAGTYDPSTNTGGPRGSLRFKNELSRDENKGLKFALDQIEDIKHEGNHITELLSYGDLIQLGGYCAVEYCGGPVMHFKMGRIDAVKESDVAPQGRLPDSTKGKDQIFQKLSRWGLDKRLFVALMGSHTLGFAHEDRTGFKGRWTMNPYVFDNTYYKEVLLGPKTKYLRTPVEEMLLEDKEMRSFTEEYAQDQNRFFTDYAEAHVKMSELGQEANLLDEFEPID